MAMQLVKKTSDYKIFKRGDGRFAVQNANGKPVNGEEKVKALLAEDLIKVTLPSPVAEPEAEPEVAEAAVEAESEEAAEGESEASEDVAAE